MYNYVYDFIFIDSMIIKGANYKDSVLTVHTYIHKTLNMLHIALKSVLSKIDITVLIKGV